MNSYYSVIAKSMSPVMLAKALRTFDRITIIVVGLCWGALLVVMVLGIYTIHLSVAAKSAAEEALVAEPALPTVNRTGVNGKELQGMIDRLQRRYPDVGITWSTQNNVLTINGANGGRYHQWLTAIGQLDTLSPQYHWSIASLCVGTLCSGQNIMTIDLTGQKYSLEMPHPAEK